MLERAATSIGAGARKHNAIPDVLTHSRCRRRLHTPLRRHGTRDPHPLAATAPPDSLETFFQSLQSSTSSSYIQPTVPSSWCDWQIKAHQWKLSSSVRPPRSISPPRLNQLALSLRRFRSGLSTTATPSDTLLKLQEQIRSSQRNETSNDLAALAWDSFTKLPEHEKTPPLIQALIPLLASSTDELVANQIIPLFDAIDPVDRQPLVYPIIITRLLNINRTGKAVAIIDAAVDAKISPPNAGIDILLQHLIFHRQWQFVFHVFPQCLQSFANRDLADQWCQRFFTKICRIRHYASHVQALMTAIKDFPNAISPETDPYFVNKAVEYVLHQKENGFGLNANNEILATLADMRVLRRPLFDVAILHCLRHPRASPADRLKIAFNIYQRGWNYKTSSNPLYRSNLQSAPSRKILVALLRAATQVRRKDVITTIHRDWGKHWGVPSSEATRLLMRGYTEAGDVDSATKALNEFVAAIDGNDVDFTPDAHLVVPLLHAYAMRANPGAVRSTMAFMKREMRVQPDLVSWNILIHAYQKNDDLEGALKAYSELVGVGLQPDKYTYGTLMALCAHHGDLSLVEELMESAEQHGVRPSSVMHSSIVLAWINNRNLGKAEQFANFILQKSEPQSCTYMYNLLLQAYSALPQPTSNVTHVRRIMHFMRQNNVPLDSYSYSHLMRAYVRAKQTSAAEGVLFNTLLRDKKYKVTAFHFAIVVDGYANQNDFEKGMSVHAHMLSNGIKPNISSNISLMKLHGEAAKRKVAKNRAEKPLVRIDVAQELLNELLNVSESEVFWSKDPSLGASVYKGVESYPAAYFDFLLSFYEGHGAHDMVDSLLDQYLRKATKVQGGEEIRIPFRLLGKFMTHSYRKSEHTEVDKYWGRTKDLALKVTSTGNTILNKLDEDSPRPPQSGSESNDSDSPSNVIPLHRKMLARPLDVYMRSLNARGLVASIRETIYELLSHGFELDNTNWNHYVNILAQNELYEEAFTVTETHLVQLFEDQYNRRKAEKDGTIEPHTNPKRQQALDFERPRAQYRSMLALARKIQALKMGFWFDKNEAKGQILNRLREIAPRTMAATWRIRTDAYGKPMVNLIEQEVKPFSIRDEYGKKMTLNPRKRRALRAIWLEPEQPTDGSSLTPDTSAPADPTDIEEPPVEYEPPPDVSTIFMSVFGRPSQNRKMSLPPDFWQGG